MGICNGSTLKEITGKSAKKEVVAKNYSPAKKSEKSSGKRNNRPKNRKKVVAKNYSPAKKSAKEIGSVVGPRVNELVNC